MALTQTRNSLSAITANETEVSEPSEEKIAPNIFDEFLPWACRQLQTEMNVIVKKIHNFEYVDHSAKSAKGKKQKQRYNLNHISSDVISATEKDHKSEYVGLSDGGEYILIEAFYEGEDLVHIQFGRNNTILIRKVFRIIQTILQFYPHLYKVTINSGLTAEVLYDLSKFATIANITELVFDDCFFVEANYHIILDEPWHLTHLSLARCQITDDVVKTIADKLIYPQPASEYLSILNFSSNFITDTGANHIAYALRSNRHLKYLNLAGNFLTDEGANLILASLGKFPLDSNDYYSYRFRYFNYALEKNALTYRLYNEMKTSEEYLKLQSNKLSSTKKIGVEKGKKTKTPTKFESSDDVDAFFYAKAANLARSYIGEFVDPFSRNETFSEDNLLYSYGNNTLCYLNLSYNELTLLTLTKIIGVLTYQKKINRIPGGLINLKIEGNPMPDRGQALVEIEDLLETRLFGFVKSHSATKKKGMVKHKV